MGMLLSSQGLIARLRLGQQMLAATVRASVCAACACFVTGRMNSSKVCAQQASEAQVADWTTAAAVAAVAQPHNASERVAAGKRKPNGVLLMLMQPLGWRAPLQLHVGCSKVTAASTECNRLPDITTHFRSASCTRQALQPTCSATVVRSQPPCDDARTTIHRENCAKPGSGWCAKPAALSLGAPGPAPPNLPPVPLGAPGPAPAALKFSHQHGPPRLPYPTPLPPPGHHQILLDPPGRTTDTSTQC